MADRGTVEENKKLLKTVREHAELNAQASDALIKAKVATNPVRTMNHAPGKSGVASKLKKAGVTLIAMPDPVTGVIGVPVLAAGVAIERMGKRDLSIPEVASELSRTLKELERIRRANLR